MARLLTLCCVSLACLASPSFAQEKKAAPMEGKGLLTGLWRGAYHYPDDGQEPVSFQMVIIQDGGTIIGLMKEPNTFGGEEAPLLHALSRGKADLKERKVSFTKTYDGTAMVGHDVEYAGELSKDGKKLEGMWDINGFSGKFTLDRVADTQSGAFSGIYTGTWEFPKDARKKEVNFQMIVVHQGKDLVGFMKEQNRNGKDDPWLHAGFKGKIDEKGNLKITKVYDGTAGESHEVQMSGQGTADGAKVEGTWTRKDERGTFRLQRAPVEAKTLEGFGK